MFKLRNLNCVLVIFAVLATVAAHQKPHRETSKETLEAGENVLWVDPGDPATLDFRYGIGGSERQPQPPFRFVDEDTSGTAPKINVTDDRGIAWNVKWGHEPRASTFCTRLVWACGYFVPAEYFIVEGRVDGVHGLKRAKSRISSDGSFRNARFQLRTGPPTYLEGHAWTWTNNPFSGTRQLQGLKILMLLVSNWDAKDARDTAPPPRGVLGMDSNLAIFLDDRTSVRRYLYANVDWGASLGKWGGTLTWTKWDCNGFASQTSDFIKGVKDPRLRWGFNGKHRKDLTADITVSDVQWLLQYLGRITDEQIRIGLAASGATAKETACYTQALRQRIEMLQQTAGTSIEATRDVR
jgi:hypothetical protein